MDYRVSVRAVSPFNLNRTALLRAPTWLATMIIIII